MPDRRQIFNKLANTILYKLISRDYFYGYDSDAYRIDLILSNRLKFKHDTFLKI